MPVPGAAASAPFGGKAEISLTGTPAQKKGAAEATPSFRMAEAYALCRFTALVLPRLSCSRS
jgi:hypothetical protein